MENLDKTNFELESTQKKLFAMSMKDDDLSDSITMSFKKLGELNSKVDEFDGKQSANLFKVEGKFNPLNKTISSVQVSLTQAGEKAIQLEQDIRYYQGKIEELESAVNRLFSMREQDMQQKSVKKTKAPGEEHEVRHEVIKVESRSMSFDTNAIDSFKNEMAALSANLLKSAKDTEEKLKQEVSNSIKILNEKVQKIKQENEESFKEVNEKLTWLPVNVSQMSNMTPNEARLFTLEARLRSEENSRIKSFAFLSKLVEAQRIAKEFSVFQDLNAVREKRDTPDGLYTVEMLRKLGETDKRSVEYKEPYSSLMDGKNYEEGMDFKAKHKTPRSRENHSDFFGREARTSSVMGRRILRKTLN